MIARSAHHMLLQPFDAEPVALAPVPEDSVNVVVEDVQRIRAMARLERLRHFELLRESARQSPVRFMTSIGGRSTFFATRTPERLAGAATGSRS